MSISKIFMQYRCKTINDVFFSQYIPWLHISSCVFVVFNNCSLSFLLCLWPCINDYYTCIIQRISFPKTEKMPLLQINANKTFPARKYLSQQFLFLKTRKTINPKNSIYVYAWNANLNSRVTIAFWKGIKNSSLK